MRFRVSLVVPLLTRRPTFAKCRADWVNFGHNLIKLVSDTQLSHQSTLADEDDDEDEGENEGCFLCIDRVTVSKASKEISRVLLSVFHIHGAKVLSTYLGPQTQYNNEKTGLLCIDKSTISKGHERD